MAAACDRLNDTVGLVATMRRAGMIAPLRPDKYLRIAAAMRRENVSAISGFASAAQRCPDRPGLVDELGTLTWREIDQRCDAFAAALQALPGGQPRVIGIMCRNHRGFIEAVVAANRIGADLLLLNTSFAGPALAEVVAREGADTVVYDEEFTEIVDRALADSPDATRIVAWTDDPSALGDSPTVEKMIAAHAGQATEARHRETPNDPADLRHHRYPQGRQADRRRPQRAQGDPGPHPVAHRGGHRRRGTDVSRMGLLAADLRRDDGMHDRHPPQVRPRGDAWSWSTATARPGWPWCR